MSQRKRIVLTTFGSLGDLHPYLALARRLKERGHSPVLATSAVYREKIEADGIEFAPCRPDERDFGETQEVVRRANHPLLGTAHVIRKMILPWLRASYSDLYELSAGADLIVAHPLAYAAPLVADKRRIPWAGTLLQPIGFFSAYDPPCLPIVSRLPFPPLFNRAFIGLAQFAASGWLRPLREFRAELGLGKVPMDSFLGQFSPCLTLAMFSPAFGPPQKDWPEKAQATGFAFYDQGGIGYEKPDPRLQAFLDQGDAPIVFTLGSTIVRAAGSFFDESLEAMRSLDRRAVLVVGTDKPIPRLPAHLLAVPYAAYGALFPHALMIVHHGGIGTTAQALRSGRPQLIVPHAHDQPDNAARVARLGCGRTISARGYRASRVSRTISGMLKNQAFVARAAEIGRTIQEESGADKAADELERLLRSAGSGEVHA